MSELNKSILSVSNNQNIRAFLEDGVLINRSPIKEYIQYSINNMQSSNIYSLNFNQLNSDINLIKLIACKITGTPTNDEVIIKIYDNQNNLINNINLIGKTDILGNSFTFNFLDLPINKNNRITFECTDIIDYLLIYGEKCFINSPILITN